MTGNAQRPRKMRFISTLRTAKSFFLARCKTQWILWGLFAGILVAYVVYVAFSMSQTLKQTREPVVRNGEPTNETRTLVDAKMTRFGRLELVEGSLDYTEKCLKQKGEADADSDEDNDEDSDEEAWDADLYSYFYTELSLGGNVFYSTKDGAKERAKTCEEEYTENFDRGELQAVYQLRDFDVAQIRWTSSQGVVFFSSLSFLIISDASADGVVMFHDLSDGPSYKNMPAPQIAGNSLLLHVGGERCVKIDGVALKSQDCPYGNGIPEEICDYLFEHFLDECHAEFGEDSDCKEPHEDVCNATRSWYEAALEFSAFKKSAMQAACKRVCRTGKKTPKKQFFRQICGIK
ncbi:MAG: hypothetical protein M0R76_03085 [Proteobacteria bacterium]|nr:hypothetical protein [Pseudomonadota bacterium]